NEIIAKYDSLYKDPEITVQPLFKINILGEVKRPGQYYVTGVETILDVVALAGGETQDANLNKLSFVRDEERININPKELIEKGSKLQEMGLKSGDQVIVPRGWWVFLRNASVIVSFAALAVTIIALSNR
ncbi:MAG: SLBB domain-containing protein, partial [bacterium]